MAVNPTSIPGTANGDSGRRWGAPGRRAPGAMVMLLLVLAVALGLKVHYRQATPGELAWILAPTAALVAAAVGTEFEFESGAGWISPTRFFVIAPQCAGINFFIVVFLSLSLITLPGRLPIGRSLGWCGAALLVSYASTVGINALRIYLALEAPRAFTGEWLSPADQHRWAGVVVYLSALWIITGIWRRMGSRRSGNGEAGRPERVWLPVAVYLAVVLGIPLLHAFRQGLPPHFVAHCATVIGGCLFVWGGLSLLQRKIASRDQPTTSRRRPSPGEPPCPETY